MELINLKWMMFYSLEWFESNMQICLTIGVIVLLLIFISILRRIIRRIFLFVILLVALAAILGIWII